MDYGALIREAWATTWRHRFLWVLGIFAGGVAATGASRGGGVQWRGRPEDMERVPPQLASAGQEIGAWMAANVGLLVGIAVVAALFGIAMLVVSLVAQGGMAEATVDLASGRGSSAGRAWRTGLRLFWRYLGLWLSLIALAVVVAAVIGAIVAAVVGVGALVGATGLGRGLLFVVVALGVLLGIALVLALIVAAIAVSIVVAYAQRAIFAEDVGPLGALRSGLRLLRAHPGTSALVWLINLALGIGAGIATLLAFGAVLLILGVPGIGLWALAGLGAPLLIYGAGAALVLLVAGALFSGIANTFIWSFWTLAYLQLTGRRAGLTPA